MKKLFKYSFLIFAITCSVYGQDNFDKIKKDLSQAECIKLQFISIIESDIFDTIDSIPGHGIISKDNKYNISIGDDIYINDKLNLYSYSIENNQVIIEPSDIGNGAIDEITFLKNLDKLFNTTVIMKNRKYRLTKKKDVKSELPDSMLVLLNNKKTMIEQIIFKDLNDDLNRIIIKAIDILSPCLPDDFIPKFPESADRIKL